MVTLCLDLLNAFILADRPSDTFRVDCRAVREGERALILTKHLVCMVCPYTRDELFSLFCLSKHHNDPLDQTTLYC